MQKDDITEKHAELVLDALTYAHDNNLDITSKEDVAKILEALKSKYKIELTVEVFIPILEAGLNMIEADAKQRKNR